MNHKVLKNVEIHGKVYSVFEGYPKFGFHADEGSKKISIANIETKEETKPFVDDVVMARVPLETWTADYVVALIEGSYYLVDNNGNAFFKSDMPYIICRNVFVSGDKSYFINCKMECTHITTENGNQINIEEVNGYKFALVLNKITYNQSMIMADGGIINGYYFREIKNLYNWYEYSSERAIVIFDNAFKVSKVLHYASLVGSISGTFVDNDSGREKHYSTYFNAYVDFEKFKNLEIIMHNGKLYFFKPNNEVEESGNIGVTPRVIGKYFVYLEDLRVVVRDFDGKVIAREEISPKEALDFALKAEMITANEELFSSNENGEKRVEGFEKQILEKLIDMEKNVLRKLGDIYSRMGYM